MKSVLNKFKEFIIIYDEKEKIKFANESLLKNIGYDLDEIIEKDIDFLLIDENEKSFTLKTKDEKHLKIDGNIYFEDDCYYIIGDNKDFEKSNFEKALKVEKYKNEFLANISHELKTPINIILGTMQLIKRGIDDENITYDNLKRYTEIIKQNSYRLLRLVNNVIDINRVNNGYYELNFTNQNIVKIIEDITLSVAEYMKDRDLELIFDTEHEEIILSCDPDKIERVLLNILSNAIKYTPNGGKIEVTIKKYDEKVEVSIKDNGVGIPKDKLGEIFNRFTQANNFNACDGSGIGLSLVKSILKLHGGDIKVISEVNEGSEFIFELPIKISDENLEIIKHDNTNYHIEKCNIEFADIYS
jgi:signal transduction histidine kinase